MALRIDEGVDITVERSPNREHLSGFLNDNGGAGGDTTVNFRCRLALRNGAIMFGGAMLSL
ncbi:MAG TPA: hypothetical protein VGX92_21710 [Pyrinomonadaceae bacterium]|jgi:hypothetical protein|nr:hypothetical protein [Pyrinomonadaceae bacterium]